MTELTTETAPTETVDIEALAIEHRAVKDSIEKKKASYEKRVKPEADRLAEIERLIAANAPAGDNVFGSKQVRVTPGKKADSSKLEEAYPMDKFPQFWTHNISATEVKKEIGANEYSRYQIPNGKTTLTINDTI